MGLGVQQPEFGETRAQQKVGAMNMQTGAPATLQGMTVNPQASVPEAIAQGSL